ncbi:MAG: leucine-rich repeat domain-containing protein, partial [Clostridia bacterium]|nr:leucine-rich repeat domain-containing protein [Clostridia bacterium]
MYKNKKSIVYVIFTFAIITTLCFAQMALPVRAESGKCGNELNWSFSAGTLVITGKGEMTNFTEPDMAPWYHLREEITRIVLPEGLTRIGNLAFFGCKNLKTAVIPEYVKRIGEYAFANCMGLTNLSVSVTGEGSTLGAGAFNGCTALSYVNFVGEIENLPGVVEDG